MRDHEHWWARFKRETHAAKAKRDADPVRVARSLAFVAANREQGSTPERAIAAANAAEIEVRAELGIIEPLDTSAPAAEWPNFPSDVRSMDHYRPNE